MNNGDPRDIDWTKEPWKSVNYAVDAEFKRTAIGARFLPPYGPISADAKNVPSDTITITKDTMSVDDDPPQGTTAIVDAAVEFTLNTQQFHESDLTTIYTLATRAANLLAQTQDLILFQGSNATSVAKEFFGSNPIVLQQKENRKETTGLPPGLVGLLSPTPKTRVKVPLKHNGFKGDDGDEPVYSENTARAVAKAYSLLQAEGHNGPYALVLQADQLADTLAPLDNTLIMPADRIKPFVTETDTSTGKDEVRFYGTGTLPPLTGVMVSLGGNSMDLVVATVPAIIFTETDKARLLHFQVCSRYALRLKDPTAVVQLDFEKKERPA